MTDEQQIEMHLVTLWEEAKGKLRAMVEVSGLKGDGVGGRWERLEVTINDFVQAVESHELHR